MGLGVERSRRGKDGERRSFHTVAYSSEAAMQNSLFHLAGAAFDCQRHPSSKIALDKQGLGVERGYTGKLDIWGERGAMEAFDFPTS